MEDQALRWNRFDVPGVVCTDDTVAGLPVRVVRPSGALPGRAMVYLHGGGWTAGSYRTHDHMVRRLAVESAMVVVSVDYRLAPEHPAPAAVHDTLAVLDALASPRILDDPDPGLLVAAYEEVRRDRGTEVFL